MLKGHLDMIVLAALSSGPAHGYAVIQEIRRRSGGAFELPEGTIYPALHRLEQSGLLSSRWTVGESGRQRRVYSLTRRGHRVHWQISVPSGSALRMPSAVSSGKQAMQEPSPVTEYLDALSREFGFDTALSQRVRNEIEDHLWESIAHEAGVDSIEAQYRAIARFGDPREIARQYAASSLFSQTRRVGFIALLALIGVYIAMKGRGAWYGLMQWELSDRLKEAATTWISIDLNAFRIALAVGIIGLGYIGSRRAPISFHEGYRRQVRRCVVLCTATAGALLASVVTDTILTGLRLFEANLPASGLIPALSVAAEIVLVSALALHLRATMRRAALASALFEG